jgi:hypothetical protein
MRGKHGGEAEYLTEFLNLDLGSVKAKKFLVKHDLGEVPKDPGRRGDTEISWPRTDLDKAQSTLSFFFMQLQPSIWPGKKDTNVFARIPQPETANAGLPPPDSDRELANIVDAINRAEFGAQWIIRPAPPAGHPNITVGGSRWRLEKYPHGRVGKVFGWLTRILERDELSQIGCCRVCRRFFVTSRDWGKYCRRPKAKGPSECKKLYDNRLSPRRKVTRILKDEAKRERSTKNGIKKFLQSDKFRGHLPGRPNERVKRQQQEVERLISSSSVVSFLRESEPAIKLRVEEALSAK